MDRLHAAVDGDTLLFEIGTVNFSKMAMRRESHVAVTGCLAMREVIRIKYYSIRTEAAYLQWVRRLNRGGRGVVSPFDMS